MPPAHQLVVFSSNLSAIMVTFTSRRVCKTLTAADKPTAPAPITATLCTIVTLNSGKKEILTLPDKG